MLLFYLCLLFLNTFTKKTATPSIGVNHFEFLAHDDAGGVKKKRAQMTDRIV